MEKTRKGKLAKLASNPRSFIRRSLDPDSKPRDSFQPKRSKDVPNPSGPGSGGSGRRAPVAPVFEESDEEDDDDNKKRCPCAIKLRSTFKKRLRIFNEVSATNLKIGTGAEVGLWDSWGVYYCSSRFGRCRNLNTLYFSIASLFVISQGSSMLNLIYDMRKHGGVAFLVVLTLVYVTVGYPMYVFETMMGQYCGRKPMMMLRLMLPALTGVGPALYLRTIVKAINALGILLYCGVLAFSLFFCRTNNPLVYRFLAAEARTKTFNLFYTNITFPPGGTINLDYKLFYFLTFIILPIVLLVLVSQNLKMHGAIAKIVVLVLLLGMGGYLLVGLSRISEAKSSSIVYSPLMSTLTPNWKAMFNGQAWLDAMTFVIQSLELGTLVHPYLGSKNFFHYRCHRDGLYLVLLALAWNIGASVAALSWLGYIGVNHAQMTAATEHLFGHYGLVIVFMLKHIQAEMTQNVQGDVLFFNACFYSIVAVAALCALLVYIIIIVDCSYPESGQWILKILTMFGIVVFFGVIIPFFVMQDEGLRILIFINFYVHRGWSPFFILACYFSAVAFGHDMGKFVHDFLNIIHLKGYQSKQHSYHVPRTLRYFILAFLGLGMVCSLFSRPYPHEGQTNWNGSGQYIGTVFAIVPLLSVVSIAIYYRKGMGKLSLKPHRDWFKNKHHTSVCFAGFAQFKGIPALRDPDPRPDEAYPAINK